MIDCHTHLAIAEFDGDREDVIRRARIAGVETIVVVGEDLNSSLRALTVCRQHPEILRPCIGFHPDRFSENRPLPAEDDIEALCALVENNLKEISCIGEVGLDFWSVKDPERRAFQENFLSRMVALANSLHLPLNVHSRSAGHYTLNLLSRNNAGRVLMHAFDGKARYAEAAAASHGWLFSIPPSIVRSPQKQKLAKALPLDAIALESDSPALGPDRHTRNEPANLTAAVRCIAGLKQINEETVKRITTENAGRLLRLI